MPLPGAGNAGELRRVGGCGVLLLVDADGVVDRCRSRQHHARADHCASAHHGSLVNAAVPADDDIVFLDFGPIFAEWEADFGRTYVLGDDPVKLRLRDALPVMFRAGRRFFEAHEDVTGEQLYAYMTGLAEADGWTFGGTIAGHLVGQFPHEKIAGEAAKLGWTSTVHRTDHAPQGSLIALHAAIGGT